MVREFEKIAVDEVPLEHVREVIDALAKHFHLSLYRYEWHDGGRDFEFRENK